MDSTTLLAIALVFSSLSAPLTVFVLSKWGVVGGTPRELVKADLEVKAAQLSLENKKHEIVEQQILLQQQQAGIQAQRRQEHAQAQERAQAMSSMVLNPQAGFRGVHPPMPGAGLRGPPNGR